MSKSFEPLDRAEASKTDSESSAFTECPPTWLDDDGETTLWQCNDCGRLVPMYDELCGSCFREELQREFSEQLDPYGFRSDPSAF
jgi:hypothetical protein